VLRLLSFKYTLQLQLSQDPPVNDTTLIVHKRYGPPEDGIQNRPCIWLENRVYFWESFEKVSDSIDTGQMSQHVELDVNWQIKDVVSLVIHLTVAEGVVHFSPTIVTGLSSCLSPWNSCLVVVVVVESLGDKQNWWA
jgi:hypothetical protein